jgi:elongation of very long chain fatty acids protein 6
MTSTTPNGNNNSNTVAAAAATTTTSDPTTIKPQRKKKSSFVGDSLFILYIVVFLGTLIASSYNKIPYLKFELMEMNEIADWARWMISNQHIPWIFTMLYLGFTFGIQSFMEPRVGLDQELRLPLAIWSLLLSLFSFAGAVRTVPRVLEIIGKKGVMHLVCGDTRFEWLVEDPAGFWTLMFCLSKIPELLDTAFIVLRKKELITLHWYHHFTVMLFCWQSWATCCVNGIVFAAMNLFVHTVMYMFYALTAIGYRPTTFAMSITLGQIAQMVVGTAVTGYVTLDKIAWHPVKKFDFEMSIPDWMMTTSTQPDDGECHVSSGNALAGLVMYASYLALFVEFFHSAYLRAPLPGGKRKAE